MESRTIRRIGVVLLFLLLLVGQGNLVFAQQTAQINDVPADHWAWGVQKLVRKVILPIPMELFRSNLSIVYAGFSSWPALVDIEKGLL